MYITHFHKTLLTTFFVLCLTASNSFADQMRSSLFGKADEAIDKANKAQAHILAPTNYTKAKKLYVKAEERFKRNKSIERIKKDLAQAVIFFNKSTEASKLAEVTFQSVLKARSDALAADAETKAQQSWSEAELEFSRAASTMEQGNLKKAKRRAQEAEKIFRSAELSAIKNHYLTGARKLLATAKKGKVDKHAPKTLTKARQLLAKAEKELNENRYDTDYARSLARQARYEANHAIYLAKRIKELKGKDQTIEDFLLDAEVPIAEIASTLDHVAEFDNGFSGPTEEIKNKVKALQRDSYELGERRTEINFLEKEIALLEKRLGIQSERLALQEAQRDKLKQATQLFRPDEAIVMTQGDNFLIRPIGLTFAPGSSQIETRNFQILKKLQEAISIYDGYEVVVEGHTDSFGSDTTNLTLSLERAKSVRTYILANMNSISTGDIEALGYGETRPIANNETQEGRKRNRRIDFVLKPKTSARVVSTD